MKKIGYLLAILSTLALMLIAGLDGIGAAAPTPTPTLRPLASTPTSAYLYLRPTPTPFAIVVNSQYSQDFIVDAGPVADTAINIWNLFNKDHVLDFIICGAIVMMVVQLEMKLIGRYNREAVNQG